MEETWKRDDALSFLMAHNLGVLATATREAAPHARTVYYSCDDDFNIYFITLANTRKATDIHDNPHAAFVVSEAEIPRTIQIEGEVEDLTESAHIDPILGNLLKTLQSNETYGPPLGRLDTSTLKFYKIKPTWIRWGNFVWGQGTKEVVMEFEP